MKKNLITKGIIVSVLLTSSAISIAGHYNSTIVGIDVIGTQYQPPQDVSPDVCERFEQDPQTGEDDVKAYKACASGVAAARYMGERFAAGEGKYLGCLDGFQQGLYRGYNATMDPTPQMLDEAKRLYSNLQMPSAIRRATESAESTGSSIAESEIIGRFREVVGTNQEPDSNYYYPTHNFDGFTNGYGYDGMIGDVSTYENLGWLGSNYEYRDLVSVKAIHPYHVGNYTPQKICDPMNTLFYDQYFSSSIRYPSLWDLFSSYGRYNFKKYGWKNEKRSWKFWRDEITGNPDKFEYINMKPRTHKVPYKVKVGTEIDRWETVMCKKEEQSTDANGQLIITIKEVPCLDANGNVVKKPIMRDVFETRYKTEVVPGRGKAYYQGIFENGFKQAYKEFYVAQYFSLAFVVSHTDKQQTGELVGEAIGRQSAKEYANVLAYNEKYQRDSVGAFNISWETNYDKQWAYIWDKFENNAMVEINSINLIGENSDDIFKAGERMKANVSLTNLGRVSQPIMFALYGDIDGQSKGHRESEIPVSNRFDVTTPFFAKIDKGFDPRESAGIGVMISGPTNVDSSLVTRRSQRITINDVAEIDNVNGTLKTLQGSGTFAVRIENPSNKATNQVVKLRVDLGTYGIHEPDVLLNVPAKGTITKTVLFDGLDPLDLIDSNGVSGTVETMIAGKSVHKTRGASLRAGNSKRLIAKYLTTLVSTKSNTVSSGSDSRDGRIAELNSIIQRMVRNNISRELNWNDASDGASSIIGYIGEEFLAAKVAGILNDTALEQFNQLGVILDTMSDDVPTFKRKSYKAAINKFAPSVEIRKKNK